MNGTLPTELNASSGTATGPQAQHLRVLIVEDNSDDAALMMLALRHAGYQAECVVVSSVNDFEAAFKTVPDIVLADYNVPGLNAPELLRRLSALESTVPVIVVSGVVDESVVAQTIKAGATDYLLKDRMLRLGPAVASALHEVRLEHERERLEASRARTAMRMHAVVEHLTDAVFTVGYGLQIESANSAAREMFGLGSTAQLPNARDLIRTAGGQAAVIDRGRDDTVPRWSEGCGVRNDGFRFAAEWCFTEVGPAYAVMVVRDITRRKAAMSELKARSLRDPLTKLPNRALFTDRLTHAIADSKRSGTRRAVMLLDLDGFKEINDRYGHMAGDTVLRVVAYRLEGCLRATDTVARLGGDEFAVVLAGDMSAEDAYKVACKLNAAARKVIRSNGAALQVTASIGIAIFPTDATTADSVVREADAAMYFAKRNRRGVHLAGFAKGPEPKHDPAGVQTGSGHSVAALTV